MMRIRDTLIVVLLAALLAPLAWWVWQSDRTISPVGGSEQLLLASNRLPIEDVVRVRLERRDMSPLVFESEGDAWLQIEPFTHPMQAYSIRQLIASATQLRMVRALDGSNIDEASLADLGLSPPEGIVTYTLVDGEQVTIELGRRGLGGRAYARLGSDDGIVMVGQELHDRALAMDPKEWRSRRIFEHAGVNSERVEIEFSEAKWQFHRERRRWSVLSPVATRANDEAMTEFLAALSETQLSGFAADQPERLGEYGLQIPLATLSVTTPRRRLVSGEVEMEPTTERLYLGRPRTQGSNEYFAMIESRPVVFILGPRELERLFATPELLIDLSPTGVLSEDVRTIRITGPEGDVVLERDGERWVTPSHPGTPVSADRVNNLLEFLTAGRATDLIARDFAHDMHVATFILEGFDGLPMDAVRVAREAPTAAWQIDNGDQLQRIFPPTLDIPMTISAFRAR